MLKKEKAKAALGFIFVTLLIDVIGFGIIIPVLPTLVKSLIPNGTMSDAAKYSGWMLFAFAVMQFFFSPVLGNLSDKFGRRPVLLLSLFGFGIDYLFLALAPTIGWLFLGRIIAGIMGASFTTATAYIADISTPEKRAQNFGMIGVAFGVGFIIGPVLGGLLGQFGSRIPFLAAAALSLINCLYGYFVLPESLDEEHRRPFNWKRANPIGSLMQVKKHPVIAGLVGSLLFTWTFFTIEKFQWTERQVGYSLGVVGVLVAIVQGGLIRVINPKLGAKRSVYFGLALYAIGLVLFAFANKGWMMYAFLVPYCLGGIAGPALQGIISGQVPANEQGELQGGLTSLISLTSIVGPLLMTNLFAHYSSHVEGSTYFPGAPFLLGAVLTIISLVLAMRSLASYDHPLYEQGENEDVAPPAGH
jgi:DHA1 family tetracycline resistance protein-like MFS transporter